MDKIEDREYGIIILFNLWLRDYLPHEKMTEALIIDSRRCLEQSDLPESDYNCEYCNYNKAVGLQENRRIIKSVKRTKNNILF